MPSPDPYKGAIDVTQNFIGKLESPPLRTFATPLAVMTGAEDTSYLGKLTEAEAAKLVSLHCMVTKWTAMMVQHLANDQRFGYESVSDVIRHFVELGLEYYRSHNVFDENQGFANDILRRQHELRYDAERERIRQEFRADITVFDDALDDARRTGDWEFIGRRLQKYHDMLETCGSTAQRRLLWEILSNSVATRTAVRAFYEWTHAKYRIATGVWDDEWPRLAEIWMDFYADN